MFKKFSIFALVIMLTLATFTTAFAGGGGPDVKVFVDGNKFYQDGTEDPLARLHDADVYPCGGGDPTYYYAWPHPDETWTDMGFPIERVEYSWHPELGGYDQYFDTAYGTCGLGEPLSFIYVYTSETGFAPAPWGDGMHNTCTVVSEVGPAGVERLDQLCPGDGLPDDMHNSCGAGIWDDGSDRGVFGCEYVLQAFGERRVNLRNEVIEDFDLIDVIMRHKARHE